MREDLRGTLKIRMYGPFEAWLDDAPLEGLRSREGQRLVALLTLNHGSVVPNAKLASMLWPDTGSLDSLRQSVVHVRHVLGDQGARLLAPRGGLTLDLQGADVDLIAADRASANGDTESLQELVALYRGPFLQGWEERYREDRAWVVAERDRRKEKFREALKLLAVAFLARKDYETAAAYLQRYLAGNSIDEWAWRQWMSALANSGQRAAAISAYLTCRNLFQQRYQLSPPDEMVRLYQQLVSSTQSEGSPAAAQEMEPLGGAVPLQSPYYIVRTADQTFQNALARRDSIVLVKGPRQTGKTSLLARGLQQARETGAQVVLVDFQSLSPDHWLDMGALYRALAQRIADQLDLQVSLEDTWSDRRGVNENFERYLQREVLQKLDAPLVWGLDEVDKLFGYPYANDVFALFRSWHNERSLHPTGPLTKLTLAISYASEAHLFITDLNQSPFNVGTRLTLEDFTPAQVGELNRLYGCPLALDDELRRYYDLVGGHPYLVRCGLQAMASQECSLIDLETESRHVGPPFGAHLQQMWRALSQSGDLTDDIRGMLQGKPLVSPESFFRLRSAGLIVGSQPGKAAMRCKLYARYLGERLQ
jgi:DNA-binding SARP family transcriptional activator